MVLYSGFIFTLSRRYETREEKRRKEKRIKEVLFLLKFVYEN
jgi:hypothetical protein